MVIAPGGDRGCLHQPVSVAVCITVSIVMVVFGVGVIRGRMLTNLGQMSWTGHENC